MEERVAQVPVPLFIAGHPPLLGHSYAAEHAGHGHASEWARPNLARYCRLQRVRHRRIGQRLRNGDSSQSRIAVGSSRIRLYIRVCRLRWLLGRRAPEWRKKALGFVRPGSFVTDQEPLSLCTPELAKDTSTSKDTSIRPSFLPLWGWGEIS